MEKKIIYDRRSLIMKKIILLCAVMMIIVFIPVLPVMAKSKKNPAATYRKTNLSVQFGWSGSDNWEKVSEVTQFKGLDGKLYFAINNKEKNLIEIYRIKNGKLASYKISIDKLHPLYGTIACDEKGYFYLVTGEMGEMGRESDPTVFISKYNKKGKLVKEAGYSTNAWFPFEGGNCKAAFYGDNLMLYFAREMYASVEDPDTHHQASTTLEIKKKDLSQTELDIYEFYNSHSFAQRIVALDNGFAVASEGDACPRAFSVMGLRYFRGDVIEIKYNETFHFAGEPDENGVLVAANTNMAEMGSLIALPGDMTALVAQSAKSLDEKAASESREIFIQILNPFMDNSAEAYVTTGERSGIRELDYETEDINNHGVKWLTSYGKKYTVRNVQAVDCGENRIAVLYELYKGEKYLGVYYIILDYKGNVLKEAELYDKNAKLNRYEDLIYQKEKIYWVAHRNNNDSEKLYIHTLNLSKVEGIADTETQNDDQVIASIEKAAFPDDIFREYIRNFVDVNKDLKLSKEEASRIKIIDFKKYAESSQKNTGNLIKDLTGIEYLTEIRYLDCSNLLLTKLDLSANVKLEYLNCRNNKIKELELSNTGVLKELNCSVNKLKSFPNSDSKVLERIDCSENEIEKIYTGKYGSLKELVCYGNKLTEINVSSNPELELLSCADNLEHLKNLM